MKEFKITENALRNLITTYAVHKLQAQEIEKTNEFFADKFGNEENLYDDPDYQSEMAFCASSEEWMRAIGISPESNFVEEIIEKERERR